MLQGKGGRFVCVTNTRVKTRGRDLPLGYKPKRGRADLPAAVDGSRLIPPCPPSWLKWLQLDTSLDLDVNRVCKPFAPLCPQTFAAPSCPPRTKRRADEILKAALPRAPLPLTIPKSRTLRGFSDRACLLPPRVDQFAANGSPCVITREGVAISSAIGSSIRRRGTTDGVRRQILSR